MVKDYRDMDAQTVADAAQRLWEALGRGEPGA
jgi:hypothetical protein